MPEGADGNGKDTRLRKSLLQRFHHALNRLFQQRIGVKPRRRPASPPGYGQPSPRRHPPERFRSPRHRERRVWRRCRCRGRELRQPPGHSCPPPAARASSYTTAATATSSSPMPSDLNRVMSLSEVRPGRRPETTSARARLSPQQLPLFMGKDNSAASTRACATSSTAITAARATSDSSTSRAVIRFAPTAATNAPSLTIAPVSIGSRAVVAQAIRSASATASATLDAGWTERREPRSSSRRRRGVFPRPVRRRGTRADLAGRQGGLRPEIAPASPYPEWRQQRHRFGPCAARQRPSPRLSASGPAGRPR